MTCRVPGRATPHEEAFASSRPLTQLLAPGHPGHRRIPTVGPLHVPVSEISGGLDRLSGFLLPVVVEVGRVPLLLLLVVVALARRQVVVAPGEIPVGKVSRLAAAVVVVVDFDV